MDKKWCSERCGRRYRQAEFCSVNECERRAIARGLCDAHYKRLARQRPLQRPIEDRRSNAGATCEVPGCVKAARTKGLCSTHIAQVRRTGEIRPLRWADRSATCLVCPEPTGYGRRLYCSDACLMWHRRHPDYDTSRPPTCSLCGDAVLLHEPGVSRRAGSPERKRRRDDSRLCVDCAGHRRKKHKSTAKALAARDGAICRICDEPVDLMLKAPHPRSGSVDHIRTRAEGGGHEPSNLQLAHRECNQRKSYRSYWTAS